MNAGQVVLDRRQQHLRARIAAQRSQLERQLGGLRRSALAAAVTACAGFVLLRGGLLVRALRIARWALARA